MKKYMKSLLLAALAVVAAMGFTACSDDDKFTGDPYFTLEGLESEIWVACKLIIVATSCEIGRASCRERV